MLKKFVAFLASMLIVAAFAAVDVNKATSAELDGVKNIGPVTSRLITAERKKGEFKNWDDFIVRVKGIGDKRAAQLSAEGLTIGGDSYTGASAKAARNEKNAEKKADKAAYKTDKPLTEKAKDAAVATKEAVKEAAKDAKAAVTPKPDAKPDTKADAAKPSASAAKK